MEEQQEQPGVVPAAPPADALQDAPVAPMPPRRSRRRWLLVGTLVAVAVATLGVGSVMASGFNPITAFASSTPVASDHGGHDQWGVTDRDSAAVDSP